MQTHTGVLTKKGRHMKTTTLIISYTLLLLGACGDSQTPIVPVMKTSLRDRMDNAPEVQHARLLFTSYSSALTDIDPKELLLLHKQAKTSGLDLVKTDIADLEKYMDDTPHKGAFVKCAKLFKAYQASLLAVERRFPELASDPNLLSLALRLDEDLLRSHQTFPNQIVQMHDADVTTSIHNQ